jgi:hypothetical protein
VSWPTCDQVAERKVVMGHGVVLACTRRRWHLGRHRHDQGRPPWHCTTDGVTEPCGDCDGCRYDEQLAKVARRYG